MSGAENFLRFLGGMAGGDNAASRTANFMNPAMSLRQQELADRERERAALLKSGALGKIQGMNGFDAQAFIEGGGDMATLGQLQQLSQPKLSKFEENLRTLDSVSQMTPEMKELYLSAFGKGGTTVNVGGQEMSPFDTKFEEGLGKKTAEDIGRLSEETDGYLSQVRSSEQALMLLEDNPDMTISPFAPISNSVKSAVSDFLDEESLNNVSDYQTLESQLIRNRFDVTKVLKGAITEQEQAAAQQVAGKADGTRQGLTSTLKNNIAYGTLQSDYNQRKIDYMKEQGRNYSSKKFEEYYKRLGETGQRPTLNGLLLGETPIAAPVAGSTMKWSDF